MVISDVMTSKPITAAATDTVRTVLETLFELDVRHLPIVDEGQLVGIISDRDLREVAVPLLAREERTSRVAQLLDQPISNLMSTDVLSVDPETDVSEVVDLMIEHRVGAVPVVDADSEELVGIVSYMDVLRASRDLL